MPFCIASILARWAFTVGKGFCGESHQFHILAVFRSIFQHRGYFLVPVNHGIYISLVEILT
jgi:hypothetical protein